MQYFVFPVIMFIIIYPPSRSDTVSVWLKVTFFTNQYSITRTFYHSTCSLSSISKQVNNIFMKETSVSFGPLYIPIDKCQTGGLAKYDKAALSICATFCSALSSSKPVMPSTHRCDCRFCWLWKFFVPITWKWKGLFCFQFASFSKWVAYVIIMLVRKSCSFTELSLIYEF